MGFNSGFKVLIYWHINKHNAMSHFKKLNWIEITLANNAYKIYLLIYRVLIRVAAITVYFFFFAKFYVITASLLKIPSVLSCCAVSIGK